MLHSSTQQKHKPIKITTLLLKENWTENVLISMHYFYSALCNRIRHNCCCCCFIILVVVVCTFCRTNISTTISSKKKTLILTGCREYLYISVCIWHEDSFTQIKLWNAHEVTLRAVLEMLFVCLCPIWDVTLLQCAKGKRASLSFIHS